MEGVEEMLDVGFPDFVQKDAVAVVVFEFVEEDELHSFGKQQCVCVW